MVTSSDHNFPTHKTHIVGTKCSNELSRMSFVSSLSVVHFGTTEAPAGLGNLIKAFI